MQRALSALICLFFLTTSVAPHWVWSNEARAGQQKQGRRKKGSKKRTKHNSHTGGSRGQPVRPRAFFARHQGEAQRPLQPRPKQQRQWRGKGKDPFRGRTFRYRNNDGELAKKTHNAENRPKKVMDAFDDLFVAMGETPLGQEPPGKRDRRVAALDALEGELNVSLSAAEAELTAAAAVEAELMHEMGEDMEVSAFSTPDQDQHSPNHGVLNGGAIKVRADVRHKGTKQIVPRYSRNHLVRQTGDGALPRRLGRPMLMTRGARLQRTLREYAPIRELWSNFTRVTKTRMIMATGVVALGAAVMSYFGVGILLFAGVPKIASILSTVTVGGIATAIGMAFTVRWQAQKRAEKETKAWTLAQITGEKQEGMADETAVPEEAWYPDMVVVHAYYRDRVKTHSPGSMPMPMEYLKSKVARWKLPARPPKSERPTELRLALYKLRELIGKGKTVNRAEAKEVWSWVQEEIRFLVGQERLMLEAADQMAVKWNEAAPEGVTVTVEPEAEQPEFDPRSAALGSSSPGDSGLFFFRTRVKGGAKAKSLVPEMPLESRIVVQISRGKARLIGKAVPMDRGSITRRVSREVAPVAEASRRVGWAKLGTAGLGVVISLTRLAGYDIGLLGIEVDGMAKEALTAGTAIVIVDAFLQSWGIRADNHDQAFKAAKRAAQKRHAEGEKPFGPGRSYDEMNGFYQAIAGGADPERLDDIDDTIPSRENLSPHRFVQMWADQAMDVPRRARKHEALAVETRKQFTDALREKAASKSPPAEASAL